MRLRVAGYAPICQILACTGALGQLRCQSCYHPVLFCNEDIPQRLTLNVRHAGIILGRYFLSFNRLGLSDTT